MQLIALGALIATVTGVYAIDGSATFFTPGLGACGVTNSPNDFIVAVPPAVFSAGSACGRSVNVQHNGISETVTVVDQCFACGDNDLDLSTAAFQNLASLDEGRIPVSWNLI